MKTKLLIIFLVVLIFSGCSFTQENANEKMIDVTFTEMDFYEINQSEIEFPIDLDWLELSQDDMSMTTKEDAVKTGNKILDQLHSKGKYTDYVLLGILHSLKDNTWHFHYSVDQRNKPADKLILCGGLTTIIDSNNKKIVLSWVTE